MSDDFFDGFLSGPRAARRNIKVGATAPSRNYMAKEEHLNEEFFDRFAAGPRAARG